MKVGFEAETEEWYFDAFVVVDRHLDVEEAIAVGIVEVVDVVVDFAGLGHVGVVVDVDCLVRHNVLLQ